MNGPKNKGMGLNLYQPTERTRLAESSDHLKEEGGDLTACDRYLCSAGDQDDHPQGRTKVILKNLATIASSRAHRLSEPSLAGCQGSHLATLPESFGLRVNHFG